MSWRTLSLGLLVLGFANTVAAQGQVWVVDDDGPADFATIQAGIDAAGEGDILLVKEGSYTGMYIYGKSLTIQAEKGALVTIASRVFHPVVRVTNLASSQSVRLRGLVLNANGEVPGLRLQDNSGTIWVEECSARGSAYYTTAGIHVKDSTDVVLIRSLASGTAGWGGEYAYDAGSGLVLDGASVHAFGCSFQGAQADTWFNDWTGESGPQDGGDAIRSFDAQDFVFLSDCTAIGGNGTCADTDFGWARTDGGQGLRMTGVAHVLDSRLQGGVETGHPWLPDLCAKAALDQSGPISFHGGRALHFTWEGPAREGDAVELSFEGPPHVAVWITSGPKTEVNFKTDPFGSALIGLPQHVDFAGFTDDEGRLSVTIPCPPLQPLVEGRPAFAQAFYLDPHPVGPLGGSGKLRHAPLRFVRGEGSMLVGLDESF